MIFFVLTIRKLLVVVFPYFYLGMLPTAVCGIDPCEIRKGGKKILHRNLNNVKAGVAFIIQNFRKNITNHISFIYSDKLIFFAEWLVQLYAERSAKEIRDSFKKYFEPKDRKNQELELLL